ncbi:MAG: hypothetical protein IKC32_04875 [Clostridia bacterium]|nr:hypothetical protein [Clostridia bacterium]
MTELEAKRLDEIFNARKTDFESVKAVAKLTTTIMLSRKRDVIDGFYGYLMAGFRKRDANILERFGQRSGAFVGGSSFYRISEQFKTHYHTEKAKALEEMLKTISKEAEADFTSAKQLYFSGVGASLKEVAKMCVSAIVKSPSAAMPRILLAHLLSNDDRGITTVKPVAEWILNGIEIKGSRTAPEARARAIAFAKSLPSRCYIIDDNVINNKAFLNTGSPSCKIDYMNEKITATSLHLTPTPTFLYHLANDFSLQGGPTVRGLDACTLYDLAHYMDPSLRVPDSFTMEKRVKYLAEYKSAFSLFLGDMDKAIREAEAERRSVECYIRKEEEKRADSFREAVEMISEAKAKEEAARIAAEIDDYIVDSGFFNKFR